MFRRRETLKQKVERKDAALDEAIKALTRLSKKGSLRKEYRESTLQSLVLARNERLPVDVEPVERWPVWGGPAKVERAHPDAERDAVQHRIWDEE